MSDLISTLSPLTMQTKKIDYQRTQTLTPNDDGADRSLREAKLRKAAQDFESLFMYKLLKSMRATVPESKDTGFGMETMREITDEQLAIHLAQQGGIGLGDVLYESLQQHIRQTEAADADGPPGGEDNPAAHPSDGIPLRLNESLRVRHTSASVPKTATVSRTAVGDQSRD